MEHSYRFDDHAPQEWLRVPYVATKDYADIPFLEYPSHVGMGDNFEVLRNLSEADSSSFVQTWLFFSLLREILGPDFNHDDYVKVEVFEGHVSQRLSTACLMPALHSWALNRKDQTHKLYELRDHLQKCFDRCFPGYYNDNSHVRNDVRRSISTCLTTCAAAVSSLFGSEIVLSGQHTSLDVPDDVAVDVMTNGGGWCAWHAARALWSYTYAATRVLLMSMKSPRDALGHENCTSERCSYSRHDEYVCTAYPTDAICGDTIWRSDQRTLEGILASNSIAVLRASVDANGKVIALDLVPAQYDFKYTAISHVWHDGLGNSASNSLAWCEIQTLVSKLVALSEQHSEGISSLFFWLDTLCCPVQPEWAKVKALSLIPKTYQNASRVLVLDKGLEATVFRSSDVLRMSLLVGTSLWMLRVWTLQEGRLAVKLSFRFSNTCVDYEDILSQLSSATKQADFNQTCIFDEIFAQLWTLRKAFADRASVNPAAVLNEMRLLVHLRSLSVPADEPLCLAAMVGLDVAAVEDLPGRRMSIFWKEFANRYGIDRAMIFYFSPRLGLPGYGWAPATFLLDSIPKGDARNEAFFYGSRLPVHPSTISCKGLCVRYAGWILRCPYSFLSCKSDQAIIYQSILSASRNVVGQMFFYIYCEARGQWYTVECFSQQFALSSLPADLDKCALIFENVDSGLEFGGTAILALVVNFGEDAIYVKTVWTCRLQPTQSLISQELDNYAKMRDRNADLLFSSLSHNVADTRRWIESHDFSRGGNDDKNCDDDDNQGERRRKVQLGNYLRVAQEFSPTQRWIVD